MTASQLWGVSADPGEVSSRIKELRAQLGAEGAAWGSDSLRHQFTDGANGYLGQRNWVRGSVRAKTNLLDYDSEHLRNAANSFEQSDYG